MEPALRGTVYVTLASEYIVVYVQYVEIYLNHFIRSTVITWIYQSQ